MNKIANLPQGKYAVDEVFNTVAVSSGYLPYIQLYGGTSEAVKRQKIGIGRYGLVRSKDNIEDLTVAVDILVLSWRPRAMQTGDEMLSIYNSTSPEFKKIMEKSEIKDSGCMFGPEFLIWLPSAKPTCFATFFMSSKTSRRESPNLRALMGKPATLKAQLIETKKYMWHGPVVVPCSTPFDIDFEIAERDEVMNKFNNPLETEVESVPEGAGQAR